MVSRNLRVLPVFYTDNGSASREAQDVLRSSGIGHQTIYIEDPAHEDKVVPQLLAAEGIFPSIDLIRWYARAYGRKDSQRSDKGVVN